MPILIRNCSYLVRNPTRIERDCDILLDGARIIAIGKDLSIPDGAEIISGQGCAVIPGFVNAHTHLYQNMLKGLSPGLTLVPWCNQVLFPALGAMRTVMSRDGKRLSYLWTALASIEMIRGGITSCVDMDNVSPEIIQAWNEVGFRGILAYTLTNRWVPAELRPNEEKMKRQMLNFIEEHHHPDGLTTVIVAPSTLFLCTDDFMLWSAEQANHYDLGIQIHIAETADEVHEQLQETGHTPVEHLEYLGLLNDRISAVHAVHLNRRDIELISTSGAQVVHCPKSNMKLSDGIAPITTLRTSGVPVALGTDGCASNDLLDMWEEMRAGLLLSRVFENKADVMSPQDIFNMATMASAQVAHIDAGELDEGKLADLAIVELNGVHMKPFHGEDLVNSLVFCAKSGDVRDTMINGEFVMRDRHICNVDEQDLIAEVEAIEVELTQLRRTQSFD